MATSGDRQVLTANGQTTARQFVGPVRISLSGTFGGGTAVARAKDPSGAFVDIPNTSKTAAADIILDFPPNAVNEIDVDLSGATTPNLVVWKQSTARGSGAL